MDKLQALAELCFMLLAAGSPLDGKDVTISAYGINLFVPASRYVEKTDELCSLQNFEFAADIAAMDEIMAAPSVAQE